MSGRHSEVCNELGPIKPPTPRYEVVLQTGLRVPMRDGVELATDLYRPIGYTGELGSILIRTPYGKTPYRCPVEPRHKVARMFAGQGFAVLVQELRGVFDSGGVFTLMENERDDGYDTLSWISQQPWSNGRVGTYGCSALGIAQVLLAQLCHPAHRCAIAQGSGGANGSAGGRYRNGDLRLGGAVEVAAFVPWFHQTAAKDRSRVQPKSDEEYQRAFASLPLVNMLKSLGGPPTDWEDWVSRDPGDPWGDRNGMLSEDSTIDVPALFVNSWYDVGAADALHQQRVFSARGLSPAARDHQHIILSPATHCGTESLKAPTVIGERELGDARLDCWQIYLDWFDCWLNDKPDRIEGMPRVQYYVMGRNEWRAASEWPPLGVELQHWFLRSGGNAATRLGDGTLDVEPPSADEPADTFTYDPGDPAPFLGMDGGKSSGTTIGPRDYQDVQLRPDVLCFTSPPLTEGMEVTGFVRAVLFVSSSAPDTDFVARLLDVHPDGRAIDVVDGILRVRYREGFDRAVFMEPSVICKIEIDLDATSNWFPAGHQIRLEITSSAFPRFDRNLNTGGNNWDETEWVVARNTIHHCEQFPSHVLLPVMTAMGSHAGKANLNSLPPG
ncbi:CocE/NonD family hydrolase [Mesorhizobium sp. M7A.F.Ca.US.001.04.1.1]|nr:CocE/NonD family hydrolase [Mesorhizobium sp. M7A.F.Ca.CA.002.14.1.2]RUY46025.1 CocE/NonD family hydrolase [Mesorhizobium sp. M7A.F.Ca.US.001.04.1.1]